MRKFLLFMIFLPCFFSACRAETPAPTPTDLPTYMLVLPPKWTDTPTLPSESAGSNSTPTAKPSETPTFTVTPLPYRKEYAGLMTEPPASYTNASYASIWDMAGPLNPLKSPATRNYAGTVHRSDVIKWDFALCAKDKSSFDPLMAALTMHFYVDANSIVLDDASIRRQDFSQNGQSCRGWVTVLSGWRHDSYKLKIGYELSTDASDGTQVLPMGKYWQNISITVAS